jgi:hypothetical protein
MRPVESMQDVEFNVKLLNGRAIEFDNECESDMLPGDKHAAELLFFGYLHPMKLKQCRVTIGKSAVHGRGLFASENIATQTVLSFYPAHLLSNGNRVEYNDQTLTTPQLEAYNRDYKFTRPGKLCSIIGNPQLTSNTSLLAHMVNDAGLNVFSHINVEQLRDIAYCRSLLIAYYEKIKKRCNCCIIWNQTATVACLIAMKNITKETELLVVYGATYWAQYQYGIDYTDKYSFLLKNIDHLDSLIAMNIFTQ